MEHIISAHNLVGQLHHDVRECKFDVMCKVIFSIGHVSR